MKLRSILNALAVAFISVSCIPKEEVKPEIIISPESQVVFISGLSFDAGEQSQIQTKTVHFTATADWSISITETTKALNWLSIQPVWGGAGIVSMAVTVQHNPDTSPRVATVTITCGTFSVSFTITQAGITPEVIPVSSISLSKSEMTLEVGGSETLVATVLPENATDKTVTWTSSSSSIASVDQTGKVTAVGVGNAVISAKAGDKTATCTVTVNAPVIEVTSITLDRTSATIEEGQILTLVATVSPEDATDKTVTWTSSDTDIIVVDAGGTVTAVKEGTAAVTALAGNKVATCLVTVIKRTVEVTSVTLDKSTLSLTKGDTEILVATVTPDDATDKTVTWSSSDEAVATVDQNGRVTAVGGGSATITAQAGDKTATCSVNVTVPVESVTLDRTSVALEEGQTITLTATVAPNDATDKTVVWRSSNTDIVTVDNGLVTAVSEGIATITATSGGKSASCTVTVKKQVVAVTSITLDKTTLNLTKGSSESLVATVKPDDATDKTVMWSSSNTSVASVDQTGKVTAVGTGSAVITARAGEVEATCNVTVSVPVTSISLDKTSVMLELGQTSTLEATISPDDATDKTIEWSSSNTSVATVVNGVVTAVGEGTATVSAIAGDVTATCTVTVIRYVFGITPADITISGDGETFKVTVVCSVQYSVTSVPDWISQQSLSKKVHTFKAERNPGDAERSGKIVFTDSKGTTLNCMVYQGKPSLNGADGDNEHIGNGDDINW